MPSIRAVTFTDPFPYQVAIRAADMELFPKAKGKFCADLTQIHFDQLWVQRSHDDLPQVFAGSIRPGRRSFSFFTREHQTMQHCGMAVVPGDIIVHGANFEHRRTEANCDWGSMALTHDDFDAACRAITGRESPRVSPMHLLRPSPALISRLLKLHERAMWIARATPETLEPPEAARALEQQLIHLMVRCLTEGVSSQMTDDVRRHDTIVARFEAYLEAHRGEPLYLADICAALGIAERTLRNVCEEHLGMGPIRYLSLRRIHLVRRALLRADPSEATVTRFATDYGFWEMGRFSVAYRALFGESPSETLRRPSNDPCAFPIRPSSLDFA